MKGTRVEVDLDALKYNYLQMRDLIPLDVKIAGIVKANAYEIGRASCRERV